MKHGVRFIAVVTALMVGMLASAAQAAFPGENGKLVFQGGGADPEIYTVNPDGSDLTRLTTDEFFDGQPVWSPDGRKIAFWSGRGVNGSSDIFVMNPDGSGITNVTSTGGVAESEPAWSPDGTKIAFMAAVVSGTEIFTMNADGSGVVQLTTEAAFDAQPAWSPDGTKIVYATSPDYPFGDFDIVLMNADGSGKTVIAGAETHDYVPDWSPDGTKIAFARDTSFFAVSEDVWVMNADGSGQTQLTSSTGSDRDIGPVFSPDGTKIAFGGSSFPFSLFIINADGTGRTPVNSGDQGASFPDWQPIGPNQPPECSGVRATPASLGAPNHRLLTVTISGATDPDGDPVDLAITGVTQDEPLRGPADAVSTMQPHRVRLRAERDPHGDGRVYRIGFEASDGAGGTCTGFATASVRKGNQAIDSAPPSYDSFGS